MLSKVVRTNSPFSIGKVFLLVLTLNIEISLFSQFSGESVVASIMISSAFAVPIHGVVESDLVAAAA